MEAASRPPLHLVDQETGEVKCQNCRDAEDRAAGLKTTVEAQARKLGALERRLGEDEDPTTHPQGKEIVALFGRWKKATGRKTCKLGSPRMKLVKGRIRDGFKIALGEGDDPEPTLELAVDGIASHPYRVYDRRAREGRPSDLHNDFDLALKDEKHVEDLSRLGWKARREGWTVSDGWPTPFANEGNNEEER